jgi:hypothetical protein
LSFPFLFTFSPLLPPNGIGRCTAPTRSLKRF